MISEHVVTLKTGALGTSFQYKQVNHLRMVMAPKRPEGIRVPKSDLDGPYHPVFYYLKYIWRIKLNLLEKETLEKKYQSKTRKG